MLFGFAEMRTQRAASLTARYQRTFKGVGHSFLLRYAKPKAAGKVSLTLATGARTVAVISASGRDCGGRRKERGEWVSAFGLEYKAQDVAKRLTSGSALSSFAEPRLTMNSDMPAYIGDDTAIWRYLDLPRFVSMLATKTLWFAKAAQFHDDPYEGYCQVTARPFPEDEHGPGPLTLEKTGGKPVGISYERFGAELSHYSADYFESARELLYVNSWCLADESMAMWQIYGSNGCGIAVRSSIGRYKRAFKFPGPRSQFAFGVVEYHTEITEHPDLQVDLSGSAIPMPGIGVWERMLKLPFHKRTCFEYEREWRGALYQDPRPEIPGCNIEFDLEQLISAVYVGPRAEQYFVEVVESIMDKYNLKNPVERSALLQPPLQKISAVEN